MSSAYDQQIQKLVDHIQTLNQALHERNTQIVHWQQVSRTVQDERVRIARSLMENVKQSVLTFAQRFQLIRAENKKLRSYIDHQKLLHEGVARDLHGQLQYALSRIDDLAKERGEWRAELNAGRQAVLKYQQQAQEQKAVIASQQAALTELRAQLDAASGFAELEERLNNDITRLNQELSESQNQLHKADSLVSSKERELKEMSQSYEMFKVRSNEELVALQAEVRQARDSQSNVDERVEEMTMLLANSEREVAKLFKELREEQSRRQELEIRLEATSKENTSLKRKATRLEKERDTAKGATISSLQKELDKMKKDYEDLQEELLKAVSDKTDYMKAIEGKKGKLRSLPPSAEQE